MRKRQQTAVAKLSLTSASPRRHSCYASLRSSSGSQMSEKTSLPAKGF